MEIYSTQLQRKLRGAFQYGWFSALHPNNREASLALARQALARLSIFDQHALVTEQALLENDDEKIVRPGAMVLGVSGHSYIAFEVATQASLVH